MSYTALAAGAVAGFGGLLAPLIAPQVALNFQYSPGSPTLPDCPDCHCPAFACEIHEFDDLQGWHLIVGAAGFFVLGLLFSLCFGDCFAFPEPTPRHGRRVVRGQEARDQALGDVRR